MSEEVLALPSSALSSFVFFLDDEVFFDFEVRLSDLTFETFSLLSVLDFRLFDFLVEEEDLDLSEDVLASRSSCFSFLEDFSGLDDSSAFELLFLADLVEAAVSASGAPLFFRSVVLDFLRFVDVEDLIEDELSFKASTEVCSFSFDEDFFPDFDFVPDLDDETLSVPSLLFLEDFFLLLDFDLEERADDTLLESSP